MASRQQLRPRGFDDLGLRRAIGDRLLPLLVAAMAFLAALAVAGSIAAAGLARHWQEGATAALTVQVPQPGEAATREAGAPEQTRLGRVVAILRATPGIAVARPLGDGEVAELLRPWLGSDVDRLSLPLPAVIQVREVADGADLAVTGRRLAAAAPGTLLESHGAWADRLTLLARSLQACSWAALLVVACVAAAVVTVATRSGLTQRREAIALVHGFGATDGYIAAQFSRRATWLAAIGATAGALAALPALLTLASLSAPFTVQPADGLLADWVRGLPAPAVDAAALLAALPSAIWLALPALPLVAAAIGYATAQATVRRWLRRLP